MSDIGVPEKGSGNSLYEHLYSNHIDCADHLCNDESSDVDSPSSADASEDEMIGNARQAESTRGSLRNEFIRRSNSSVVLPVTPSLCEGNAEAVSEFSESPTNLSRHYLYSEDEDDSVLSDPFLGYSEEKTPKGKFGVNWSTSKLSPLKRYSNLTKALGKYKQSTRDKDSDTEEFSSIWTDFSSAGRMNGAENCMIGSFEGKESVNLALTKRGFYTLFLKSGKTVDTLKGELCSSKIKVKYTILDCKRDKFKINAAYPSCKDGHTSSEFVSHDQFDDDSFSFLNSGSVTIGNKSMKIILLKSSHDTLLQFSMMHHLLDCSPTVLYKLLYCGWCQTLPRSISPHLRLRILSIDSCDNLGTSALAVLYALEQRLNALHGSNVKLADHFDMICGTGTGAMLALCLLKGYSIKELRVQWQNLLTGLFKLPHSMTYGLMFGHSNVNKFITHWMEMLGVDFMCTKQKPLCVVTSTNIKSNESELFLFRNYTNVHSPYAGTTLAPMWFAGWASNAIPTYVKGPSDNYLKSIGCKVDREAHFVDGQLLCTNPSLVALQEACELYGFTLRKLIEDNLEMFLSVGTTRKHSKPSKILSPHSWQALTKKAATNKQIEHCHTQQLFGEHPDRYQRIEVHRLQGCKYGRTDKPAVDKTFNNALELVNAYTGQQLEKIAKRLNF
ncbi:hypothetical protein BgAZ_209440 [Babesia gibsoni]|uniref:PNPLA domain-containing protein n=1 Tax=Babesia gibsoni TaxID=33632 RepID=A0AAD8PEU1_BABGI|nr:hypothetical protein BgAZ_209440 [Babesia gibsoni]